MVLAIYQPRLMIVFVSLLAACIVHGQNGNVWLCVEHATMTFDVPAILD